MVEARDGLFLGDLSVHEYVGSQSEEENDSSEELVDESETVGSE